MSLENLYVIGDRVLIKLKSHSDKTSSGLYLPPHVKEKEKIQSGYIMKTGPGYVIPAIEESEPWKTDADTIKYIPLQLQVGDLAIFLVSNSYEIDYEDNKYFIVGQSSVLMVERNY